MLLPFTVDVPMERVPVANWVLIAFTVLVSGVVWVQEFRPTVTHPAMYEDDDAELYEDQMARVRGDIRFPALALQRGKHFRLYQLVGYTLLHGDIFHLVGNMVFLFCFGNAINAKLGHGLFVALYFVLGAIAGAAWLLLGSGLALIGASGAIMGLTGMFLVLYPRNDVSVFYFGLGGAGTFRIMSLALILLCMFMDFVGTVVFSAPSEGGGGVAYVCHLAGEVWGAGFATALLLAGVVQSEHYEENLLQYMQLQPKTERYAKKKKKKLQKRRLELEEDEE